MTQKVSEASVGKYANMPAVANIIHLKTLFENSIHNCEQFCPLEFFSKYENNTPS